MAEDAYVVVYWDASAILSVLLKDNHTEEARKWVRRKGLHLMSTLAYSETCSVIFRMRKEGVLDHELADAVMNALDEGPWSRVTAWPDWKIVRPLANKWSLRGADLWHLCTAKTLKEQLQEIILLAFDARLLSVARGEGLA
jgi:predicted nucleic acid-binding protein